MPSALTTHQPDYMKKAVIRTTS